MRRKAMIIHSLPVVEATQQCNEQACEGRVQSNGLGTEIKQ